MIREHYNFAIKVVKDNEVEILADVVYESLTDVPSQFIGFNTEDELRLYMIQHDLIEYDHTIELEP